MVGIAQLVRASDCGSEGRGFEPHCLPQKIKAFSEIAKGFFYRLMLHFSRHFPAVSPQGHC